MKEYLGITSASVHNSFAHLSIKTMKSTLTFLPTKGSTDLMIYEVFIKNARYDYIRHEDLSLVVLAI